MTSIETPIGTEEAASILGISRPGVMDLIKRGKLVAHQPAPNQVWQVDKTSVLARLEEQSKTKDARFSRDDVREIIREELGPILREETLHAIRVVLPDLVKEYAMADRIEIHQERYLRRLKDLAQALDLVRPILVRDESKPDRDFYIHWTLSALAGAIEALGNYVTVLEEELRKQKPGS